MKLQGRVAVITGCSPNIGGGIAEALAQAGAAIVAIDNVEANAVDCARAIQRAGGSAIALTCDVTDGDQVHDAVARAEAELGGVNILVNSAATFNKKGIRDMSLAEWKRQTGIILDGTFLFTKHCAEPLIRSGNGV